jgi:PAS domain S-box-containing protein
MKNNDEIKTDAIPNIQFSDIFKLDDIQRLQDLFSDANKVASIITYPDGTPITKPSNFCRLCEDIIRKTEKGLSNCYKSDALIGSQNTSEPIVQHCLSCGLWDAGASINAGGIHIANWLIGQVKNEEIDNQAMLSYADEIGANRNDFLKSMNEVPYMSVDQFRKVAKMLYAFANEISVKAYNNFQLIKQMDVSEKASRLLTESEHRFKTLLDLAPDSFFQGDANGNFLEVNQSAVDLTLYKRDELLTMNIKDLFSREIHEKKPLRYDILENGETIQTEREIIRKDGSTVYVEMNSKKMPDGSYQSFFRDITERKKTEELIKAKQRQLSDIIDFLPDATLGVDKDKRVNIWNKAIEKMTGIPAAEMIGKGDYAYTIPFYGEARSQLMDLVFENDEKLFEYYPFIKREGNVITSEFFCNALYNNKGAWIYAKVSPLHDANGNIIGAIESLRDITESKQAEISLKEKEHFINSIAENSPDIIYLYDVKENRNIYTNRNISKLLGYSSDELKDEDTGFFEKLIHPEDLKQFDEFYKNIDKWEEDHVYNFEYRILDKSGNFRWFKGSEKEFQRYEGKVVSLIGTVRDITEKKIIDNSFKESEERFRAISENSFNAICIINEEGKISWTNEAMVQMGGYSKDEIYAADSFTAFLAPESVEFVVTNFGQFVKGLAYEKHYEFSILRKDGEKRLCEKYMSHFKDSKNQLNLVISINDITNRNIMEKALKESEDKYRTMIEYSNDLIWTLDLNGNFLFFNEVAVKTTGLNPDEWIGKSFAPLIMDEDLPLISDVFQKTIHGEVCNYELRFKKTDQCILTISVNTSPIYISGKIEGIVSFGRDITESKQAEAALKEKMDDLQRLHNITVGRELTMIALKKEINELLKASGIEEKYKIVEH